MLLLQQLSARKLPTNITIMARYLDPKNDLPFKKVFGEHKRLLISFLNALLPLRKEQEIVSSCSRTPLHGARRAPTSKRSLTLLPPAACAKFVQYSEIIGNFAARKKNKLCKQKGYVKNRGSRL
jgi:hypothetical protein